MKAWMILDWRRMRGQHGMLVGSGARGSALRGLKWAQDFECSSNFIQGEARFSSLVRDTTWFDYPIY
jgi:hypothetical protein